MGTAVAATPDFSVSVGEAVLLRLSYAFRWYARRTLVLDLLQCILYISRSFVYKVVRWLPPVSFK